MYILNIQFRTIESFLKQCHRRQQNMPGSQAQKCKVCGDNITQYFRSTTCKSCQQFFSRSNEQKMR